MATTTLPHTPAAASVGSTAESTSLYNLQQLLPTCQRCRRLRRKCDTQLPHCRPCHRAGAECTFYDHALKQSLPRAYVKSLLTRVEHLKTARNSHQQPTGTTPAISTDSMPYPPHVKQPMAQAVLRHDGAMMPLVNSFFEADEPCSFDVIIPSVSTTAEKARYWGASSVFALTVEVLQHAVSRGVVTTEDCCAEDGSENFTENGSLGGLFETNFIDDIGNGSMEDDESATFSQTEAPDADIRALVHLYLISLNTLYGFVDHAETNADLLTYLALRRQRRRQKQQSQTLHCRNGSNAPHAGTPRLLQGEQTHQYFRITMMCAIACANQARYRPERAAESLAYYADALACVEEVTSEVSPASLQALLLLIVFCLFYPRKSDIWKLLDYACRLAIELGYHTEETAATADHSDGSNGGHSVIPKAVEGEEIKETEAQRKLRRSTFWGLYAMERITGQLFGRGSDLPETIITTKYPSSLHHSGIHANSVSSMGAPVAAGLGLLPGVVMDQATLQSMSIAHHYRLVYLRSEIYRAMYLPASFPDICLDLEWLRDKYATLYAW